MKQQQEEVVIKNLTPLSQLPVDPAMSWLPVKLHGDRVIIKNVPADAKLLDGVDGKSIIKVHNAEEPYSLGQVQSIGPGFPPDFPIPADIKPGNFVNYYHQRAMTIEINGEKYHLVRAGDCFMTV